MEKGTYFKDQDRFILYDFEDVMFFWNHAERKVYMKFVGDGHETEVPHDQRLLNDAILGGQEISRDAYVSGRP